MTESSATRDVTVNNRQGFHARPANLFVQTAMRFKAQVFVVKDKERINGKSILDLLTLGAQHGTRLRLEAEGEDAHDAVTALELLVASGFGEREEETKRS
jgi:phosphotransferase system HPr (HPr) family protein